MGAFLSCCFEDCSLRESPINGQFDNRHENQRQQAYIRQQNFRQQTRVSHVVANENQTPAHTQRSTSQVRNTRSRSTSPRRGQRRGRGGRRGAPRHSSVPHNKFFPDEAHFYLEPLKTIPISELNQCDIIPKWWLKNYNNVEFVLEEVTHSGHNYTFEKISSRFQRTVKNNLEIESIHRVENVYLWLMYQLKLEEISVLERGAKENEYFHGTPSVNITSICSDNFNWRRHGDNTRNSWFGKGVSFSPLASYSSHYTDKNVGRGNKMFLAKVIVIKKCEGVRNMVLPPQGYDTTTSSEEKVFVKYDDNTFYPEYVITYAGKLENKNNVYNYCA